MRPIENNSLHSSEVRFFIGDSGKVYLRDTKEIVLGVVSQVSPRRHIPMLDYDRTPLLKIREELKKVIKKFSLSSFYILKTSRGHYHAICFSKVPFKTFLKIMEETSGDRKHYYYTKRVGKATLRISKKDKPSSVVSLVDVVRSERKEDEKLRDQYFNIVNMEAI